MDKIMIAGAVLSAVAAAATYKMIAGL